ncbi:MAG: DUF4118 domain-containing protein [Pirellulales bacterium]
MALATRTLPARYAVSVIAIAMGVVLRTWFAPYLEDRAPYVFFNIAVIVSAWWGGLGPGLLATALGAMLGAYLFIPNVLAETKDVLNCGMFALVGIFISVFINALHAARIQAEREADSAQRNWLSLCQSDERARLLAERAAQWRRLYEDRLSTEVQAGFCWSPQTDRFEVAATWTNLLGENFAPVPRDLTDWGKIVRADESEDFRAALRQVAHTRQPTQREYHAVRKDADPLGVHLRAFPVVDASGDVSHVVGLITAMPRGAETDLAAESVATFAGEQ